MNNYFYILLLAFGVVLSGCKSNYHSEMMDVLRSLESEIEPEKIQRFRTQEIDSAGQTIAIVYDEVEKAMNRIEPTSKLGLHLDSVGVHDIQVNYLAIGLHFYCRGEEVIRDSLFEVYSRISAFALAEIARERIAGLTRIAELNDSRFKVGDTLMVYLPYHEEFGKAFTYTYTSVMPEYPDGVDSVGLQGIILEKEYNKRRQDAPDSSEIVFRVLILDVDREGIWMMGNQLMKAGDTVDFNLTMYGRIIRD